MYFLVWNKSTWVYTTNMLSALTTVAIWLGDGKPDDMPKKIYSSIPEMSSVQCKQVVQKK